MFLKFSKNIFWRPGRNFAAATIIKKVVISKGRHKQGNIVADTKMRPGRKKMFLENFKSTFCFQDVDFVSSTYVALGSKRGITWQTLKKHLL